MTDCEKIRLWLEEEAFGKPSPESEPASAILANAPKEIQSHLQNCSDCRDYWREMAETDSMISVAVGGAPEVSQRLRARIRQSIMAAPAPASTPGRILPVSPPRNLHKAAPWMAAAAALLVLVMGAFHYIGREIQSAGARRQSLHPRANSPSASSWRLNPSQADDQSGGSSIADASMNSVRGASAPFSIAAVFGAQEVIEEAPKDFRWLSQAIVAQTESAARAFGGKIPGTPSAPGQTPKAIQ